jgi:hypothetical protein
VEAQKRFQQVADENRQLKLSLEAQKAIISDLSRSLGDSEESEKALQKIKDQLSAVDRKIADASTLLVEQLSESKTSASSAHAGELLRLIIEQVQNTVRELELRGISQGVMAVSVMGVIELESLIRKILEDLSEKGMFPETQEEIEARVNESKNHTAAVLEFLQGFMAAHGGNV